MQTWCLSLNACAFHAGSGAPEFGSIVISDPNTRAPFSHTRNLTQPHTEEAISSKHQRGHRVNRSKN